MLEREKNKEIIDKAFDSLEKNKIDFFACAIYERGASGHVHFATKNTKMNLSEFYTGLCLLLNDITPDTKQKLSETARDFYNFARKFERNNLDEVQEEFKNEKN